MLRDSVNYMTLELNAVTSYINVFKSYSSIFTSIGYETVIRD